MVQHHVAVGTRRTLAEGKLPAVGQEYVQQAFPARQRQLNGVRQPPARLRLDGQAVHHHIDVVLTRRIQPHVRFSYVNYLAVSAHTDEAFAHELAEELTAVAGQAALHRRQELDPHGRHRLVGGRGFGHAVDRLGAGVFAMSMAVHRYRWRLREHSRFAP
jgi:hypothetical protein